MSEARETLVYDGDCEICRYWVEYWKRQTGEHVVYRPYQEAASEFPSIKLEDFRHAIQLIEPDGQTYTGAAATYRVLRHAAGRGVWWWMYEHVPGFAPASERAYAFFARHRGLLKRLSWLLWGPRLEPESYQIVSWVFLRLLGAIYIIAFASLGVQILGLVGEAGIAPVSSYLDAARQGWGVAAYWRMPTLLWLNSSDVVLVAGTLVGLLLGFLVVLGLWDRPALAGLFVLYLSYVYAGQVFTSYQWDLLLLEVWLSRDLPHRRFAHRRLALSLAHFPLHVPIGRRKAALRQSDVARPDGPQVPLLDPAAANAARVVRRAAS